MRTRWLVLSGLLVLAGCRDRVVLDAGADAPEPTDTPSDAPDPVDSPDGGPDAGPPCEGPPGLYITGSCSVLAPGVRSFTPRYVLWSDGAEKDRFVYLPPDTTIDTTDPDAWVYPVGTIFWKTFSRDGLRVETRINEKVSEGVGPASWRMRTFAWSADQLSVTELTDGALNVLGTAHDIPPVSLCPACHSGAGEDVGLGFTAIQLNHDGSDVSLADLLAEGALSTPIATTDAIVPGDATTSAALGYMHVNCGPCHGGPMPQPTLDPMVLWVDVGLRDAADTGAYTTAVSHTSGWPGAALRIAPGDPDHSAVILRMQSRVAGTQMPPIATETPHTEGIGAIRAWIRSL